MFEKYSKRRTDSDFCDGEEELRIRIRIHSNSRIFWSKFINVISQMAKCILFEMRNVFVHFDKFICVESSTNRQYLSKLENIFSKFICVESLTVSPGEGCLHILNQNQPSFSNSNPGRRKITIIPRFNTYFT